MIDLSNHANVNDPVRSRKRLRLILAAGFACSIVAFGQFCYVAAK
jgi:hypothetical protein